MDNKTYDEMVKEQQYFLKARWIIFEDKDLSSHEKLLFILIENWSADKGYCYAKNEALAKALGWKIGKVNANLAALKERGWIRMENADSWQRRIFPVYVDPSTYNKVLTLDESGMFDKNGIRKRV